MWARGKSGCTIGHIASDRGCGEGVGGETTALDDLCGSTSSHDDNAIAYANKFLVIRGSDDDRRALRCSFVDHGVNVCLGTHIDTLGRLIKDENLGLLAEPAGNDDLLLIAAGQLHHREFGDGRTHQSGYIAIAGGWKNTVSCLARRDEHAEERKQDARCGRDRRCIEPGTDYRWTFIRTDGRVRWYVDGALFLVYDDAQPIDGRFFAFNNWEAKTSFDNLRIYDLSTP